MIQGKSGYWGTRRGFLKGIGAAVAAPALSSWPNLQATSVPEFRFELVSPEVSRISWVHHNGRSPEMYLPETVGSGCGFIDYDNDGWMDIYLVNSWKCDFLDPNPPLRSALYRNNRDGTFTEVTERAGVAGGGYGMGVAVGWASSAVWFDYDNDGNLDLFLANGHPDDKVEKHSTQVKCCEPMLLFRGKGKKFEDISVASGSREISRPRAVSPLWT